MHRFLVYELIHKDGKGGLQKGGKICSGHVYERNEQRIQKKTFGKC